MTDEQIWVGYYRAILASGEAPEAAAASSDVALDEHHKRYPVEVAEPRQATTEPRSESEIKEQRVKMDRIRMYGPTRSDIEELRGMNRG